MARSCALLRACSRFSPSRATFALNSGACCLRFDIFDLLLLEDQKSANRSLRQCPIPGASPSWLKAGEEDICRARGRSSAFLPQSASRVVSTPLFTVNRGRQDRERAGR